MKIVKEQLDDVKSAKLYSDFVYSVNFVEYDTVSSKETEIVANHGKIRSILLIRLIVIWSLTYRRMGYLRNRIKHIKK